MDPARLQRVRTLFDELVAVAEADRAAWLDRRFAGDAELRERLERLLAADQAERGWSRPVQSLEAIFDPPTSSLRKGTRIGQYELK